MKMGYKNGISQSWKISSLRERTMRVLVLTTLLAYAMAAPSGTLVGPVAPVAPVVPVALPGIPTVAALPTISPGDLQAAAINAKVLADDKAQEAIDQARSLIEEAREGIKDNENIKTDIIKERTEEMFWNVQEKQWQALDALKTAEAKLDGSIASSAPLIAKSAVGVVVSPYVAPLSLPNIPPLSPLVYVAPNLIAKPEGLGLNKIEQPLTKTTEENSKDQIKLQNLSGVKQLENLKGDTVKSAEPEPEMKLPAAPLPAVGPVLGPLALAPAGPLVAVDPTKLGTPLFAAPLGYSYIPSPILTPVLKQW